jgi:hypothetical protein
VTLALGGVLCISAWGAYRVLVAARAVIEAAEDKNTYALFITDEGLKSDNEALAAKVNAGMEALRSAESEAVLLLVACSLLAGALAWRLIKANRRSL